MPRRSNGVELRRRRELLGLTLTEFARQAGYTLNYASQVELGNCNGGPKFLREAARILNCGIEDISAPRARKRQVRSGPPATSAETRVSA